MSDFYDAISKYIDYSTYATLDITTNLVSDRSVEYWYVEKANFKVREISSSKIINGYKIEVHSNVGGLNTLFPNSIMTVRILDNNDRNVEFNIIDKLFSSRDEFINLVRNLAEQVKEQYNAQKYKVIEINKENGFTIKNGKVCIPALDLETGKMIDPAELNIITVEIKSIDI